ncbi:hypothetical protein AB6N35_09675 [Dietzia cinnamea]|uniref:Uncharacterized protein n=1 Tax=Dietzia cinnamea TaxID=321318 RepID=A0AAW5Q6Y1_9ACTN|nr:MULTISPECIES: hypothetical protein [Dietzia]MCT1863892.1 hypothetical protein [Dietzia cinnamea]MCT2029711.1 hypothetical protein [Dietzia cinnamea]MCT2033021.1 hypothetical protein [Dietzia cinnamea]MCT2076170.1 hypothetical protein [Dietzia cinnamea]MCT2097007.1 hypothetical protein [Dietzia cinnamea]
MNISGPIWDFGDQLHGSVDELVSPGSVGNVIHGVLFIPSAVLYLVSEIFWGFGS